MPRPASCLCGGCPKCRARLRAREAYQAMTPEERRAWVAQRSPDRVRAADRARHERDKDKRLAAMRSYRQTARGHAATEVAKDAWAARNPVKRRAHHAVGNAVRDGRLMRGACEQQGAGCAGRVEAHHDDYSKPLDVRWLCDAHHKAVHKEARRSAR